VTRWFRSYHHAQDYGATATAPLYASISWPAGDELQPLSLCLPFLRHFSSMHPTAVPMETLEQLYDILPLVFRHLPPAALAACECTCRMFKAACAVDNHAVWKQHVPVSVLNDPLACSNAGGNYKRMAKAELAVPRILLCQHSSNIAVTLPVMNPRPASLPPFNPPPPPSLHTRSRTPSDAPPLQMLAQNAIARSAFDGSPVFSSVRVSHETASPCGRYCVYLQTDGANSNPEERLVLLELQPDAAFKQLRKPSSRSVSIPGGVFCIAFTADSSFLLVLQDAQRRSRIYALHVPSLMLSATRSSSDISIRDTSYALALCEGSCAAFHCSPWARDCLVAITCDTELLLIKLLCGGGSSGSSTPCSHVVRRIPGCSPGFAPQMVADAVLFMRPGGLWRVGSEGEWGGEIETAGLEGSFAATRDGRYVAIKREGRGVSILCVCLRVLSLCVFDTMAQIVVLKEGQAIAHLSLNPCIFMWRESHSPSPPSSSPPLPSLQPPIASSSSAASLELVMFELCPGLDIQVHRAPFCLFLVHTYFSHPMMPLRALWLACRAPAAQAAQAL